MTEHEILHSFQKQPNGMWKCLRPIQIEGPSGSVGLSPGISFSPGIAFMGLDVAAYLNSLAAKYGA